MAVHARTWFIMCPRLSGGISDGIGNIGTSSLSQADLEIVQNLTIRGPPTHMMTPWSTAQSTPKSASPFKAAMDAGAQDHNSEATDGRGQNC
jgi:hypothetical protein